MQLSYKFAEIKSCQFNNILAQYFLVNYFHTFWIILSIIFNHRRFEGMGQKELTVFSLKEIWRTHKNLRTLNPLWRKSWTAENVEDTIVVVCVRRTENIELPLNERQKMVEIPFEDVSNGSGRTNAKYKGKRTDERWFFRLEVMGSEKKGTEANSKWSDEGERTKLTNKDLKMRTDEVTKPRRSDEGSNGRRFDGFFSILEESRIFYCGCKVIFNYRVFGD